MNKADLESLGLTKEDVLEKLVERMVGQYADDENGYKSEFEAHVKAEVKKQVGEALDRAVQTHIAPNIKAMIDNVCLTETNKWGESTGKKLTFIEYLVDRTDSYIREPVNYEGKAQSEAGSFSWNKSGTRIAYMIHEHLKYQISKAMEEALGKVNSSVRQGLQEAVNIALANIKVEVNTQVKSR